MLSVLLIKFILRATAECKVCPISMFCRCRKRRGMGRDTCNSCTSLGHRDRWGILIGGFVFWLIKFQIPVDRLLIYECVSIRANHKICNRIHSQTGLLYNSDANIMFYLISEISKILCLKKIHSLCPYGWIRQA